MRSIRRVIAFYRSNPLSLRILTSILLVSTVLATLAAAIQLYTDYRADMDAIEARLEDTQRTTLPSLIDSLWRLDTTRTQLNVKAISNLPYVAFVDLTTSEGRAYTAGAEHESKEVAIRNFRLQRPLPDGRPIYLGTLSIQIDTQRIYASLLKKFWIIVASQGAKTFTVSVFILLVLHLTIMRHLTHLAAFTERLSLNNLGETFAFAHKPRRGRPDELDTVARSLNNLRLRLVADLKEIERAHEMTEKLSGVVEASPVAIAIMDPRGQSEYINMSFTRLTGITPEEASGHNWLAEVWRHVHEQFDSAEALREALYSKGDLTFELLWTSQKGRPLWVYSHLSLLRGTTDQPGNCLLIMEDITEIKEYEQKVIQHRDYDHLTQLPNRTLAMKELDKQIEAAGKRRRHVAVILGRVGAYRSIAESLGIGFGDLLLRECADTLRRSAPRGAILGHSGEHEFLCAYTFSEAAADLEMLLKRLHVEFSRPVQLGNMPVDPLVHSGIAISPTDGSDSETLYKNALAAQQRAQTGNRQYEYFEPSMSESAFRSLRIATLLKGAESAGELQVHYQPIVEASTGHYDSMEALVRWHSTELGVVNPTEFIGVAERTGDILRVGEYILTEACRQTQNWNEAGIPLNISVNVSPTQFLDPGFVSVVSNALMATGLPAERLKLEITEHLLMDASQQVSRKAEQLTRLGIRLAIDDFGTGYSSLSYLREFPFSIVKIDQMFVRDMLSNANDRTLVKTVIDLAHNLGMEVIAEGVESAEHVAILKDYGCDFLQGYHFSKPLPAHEHFIGSTAVPKTQEDS